MKIINHKVVFICNDELHVVEVCTHTKKLSRADRNLAKQHISQAVKRKLINYGVSYSYPYIMMYFSEQKVAVDIECHTNLKPQYSTLIATNQEMRNISAVSNGSELVLLSAIWTLKEAYGKYYGVGLNFGFQSITLNDNGITSHFASPLSNNMYLLLGINDSYSFVIAHEQAWSEAKKLQLNQAMSCKVYTFNEV